jgi:hypothetical protein
MKDEDISIERKQGIFLLNVDRHFYIKVDKFEKFFLTPRWKGFIIFLDTSDV